jgi:glyoxylase-like metal-dependent hydrolase (beta-lactamase superfamily II)
VNDTAVENDRSQSGALKAAIVPVTPFQQNCTLLWNETTGAGAIIDPGGDLDRIEAALRRSGMRPEKILLTHGHIDHAAGATELSGILGVPIVGPHQADAFLLEGLEKQGRSYGIPARPVKPDQWLAEGDTVDAAGRSFAVFHCPGHSPGSVVLFSATDRFAIVGDVLFRGSIGRTDFPYGDHKALIDAIRTKLLPLGDDVAFLCGHGPGSTFGVERQSNPFLQ